MVKRVCWALFTMAAVGFGVSACSSSDDAPVDGVDAEFRGRHGRGGGSDAGTTTGNAGDSGSSTSSDGSIPPADGGAAACGALSTIVEPAEQLYVAPNGNDGAAGTQGAPLKSLAAAAKRFPNGGTIIVRGGTYGPQSLAANGAAGHPLVIRAADGETPVFDGSSLTTQWEVVVRLTQANHVVLENLTVQNGTGPDVSGIVSDVPVSDVTVRGCSIHDMDDTLIRLGGDNITFEGNDLYNGVLSNKSRPARFQSGGWAGCMGTNPNFDNPSSPWPTNITVRGNHIHDCWGEGVGIWFGKNVTIEGNTVERVFNVGIYLDNASNVKVSRNFVLMVSPMSISDGVGNGILMGVEPYDTQGLVYAPDDSIQIENNVVVGDAAVGWWTSSNGSPNNAYSNVSIINNTLISPNGAAIGFSPLQSGAGQAKGSAITNNVILEKAGWSYLGDSGAFTLSGNLWLNESKPGIAGASDATANATVGSVSQATDVEPLAASVGTGVAGSVTSDFACNARSASSPVRGAFER